MNTTSVTRSGPSSSSPPPAPSGPGYTAAKAQWLGAGLVSGGAAQRIPFQQAIADLQSGESTDPGDRSAYPHAIAILNDLTTMPDADVSPLQQAEFDRWTAQLDDFFGTPVVKQRVSCFGRVTSQSRAAAAEWSQEPVGTADGLALGPIRRAVADLGHAPAGMPCYAAAVDDLLRLETATPVEIAATTTSGVHSQATVLVGGRIAYLNVLFATDGSLGSAWNGVLNASR